MRHAVWTTIAAGAALSAHAGALPPDFLEETLVDQIVNPVGITFATDGRLFFWTQDGLVYSWEEGGAPALVVDLSDEVQWMANQGMLGFALDPDFLANGYVYLLYTVDWEWWITGGDPDPERMDRKQDSFGRLLRLTCTWDEGFENVRCGDRLILIGDRPDRGVPITSDSHGPGTLAFARDGTLLASVGDCACYLRLDGVPDVGGPRHSVCSDNSAEDKGILREKDKVGSYRSQLVDSYSGKILRMDVGDIDPKLGVAGVASNPYYDPDAPYAPGSKVWTLGLRNPYRLTIRPGTGSTDPADGDPGVILLGDVGWSSWEEASVVHEPAMNLGWPYWEGMEKSAFYPDHPRANLDAPNPLFDGVKCTQEFFTFGDLVVEETRNEPAFPNPCDAEVQIDPTLTHMHRRPAFDFNHRDVRTRVPGFTDEGLARTYEIDDPQSTIEGEPFQGRSSLGGAFNTGDWFPPEYAGLYFFGDSYGVSRNRGWIRAPTMHADEQRPVAITAFREPDGQFFPVALAFDPAGSGLYAAHYREFGGEIRRITFDCNGNGVPDRCDVEEGTSRDRNGNGRPDECDCLADIDGSGEVDFDDLLRILSVWGPCQDCDEDVNGDGEVDFDDLLQVLSAWGPCP